MEIFIYKFDPNHPELGEELLSNFDVVNAGSQHSGVTIGPDGMIYGTTKDGGTLGLGMLYRLDLRHPTSGVEVLVNFDSPRGAHPNAGLKYFNRAFYGTTVDGGAIPRGDDISFEPFEGDP